MKTVDISHCFLREIPEVPEVSEPELEPDAPGSEDGGEGKGEGETGGRRTYHLILGSSLAPRAGEGLYTLVLLDSTGQLTVYLECH